MVGKKNLKRMTAELKSDLLEANMATAEERKTRLLAENELGKALVKNKHLMFRLNEQERMIEELRRDRDVMGREVARLTESLHRTRASLSSQHLAEERKKVFKGAALLRQRMRRLLDENELLKDNIESLKVTFGMALEEAQRRYETECELRGMLAVYERFLGAYEAKDEENDNRVLEEEVQSGATSAEYKSDPDAAADKREIHSGDDIPRGEGFGEPGAADNREAACGEMREAFR